MPNVLELAETVAVNVDYWKKVQIGIGSMRWYTLLLIFACLTALIITHVVVLSNLDGYLPKVGSNFPADQIATVDLTFSAILLLGVASAIYDAKTLFDAIDRSIAIDREKSRFYDPVEKYAETLYSNTKSTLGGGSTRKASRFHRF